MWLLLVACALAGVSDIRTMSVRPDGAFDVTCVDGTTGLATADDVRTDRVCSGPRSTGGRVEGERWRHRQRATTCVPFGAMHALRCELLRDADRGRREGGSGVRGPGRVHARHRGESRGPLYAFRGVVAGAPCGGRHPGRWFVSEPRRLPRRDALRRRPACPMSC